VDGLTVGTTSFAGQPDAMSEALDSHLKFTESGTGNWYSVSGETHEYYYEADSAESDAADDEEACLQAIVDSASSQTVKFYWKVSSEQSHDYLQFYIDSTLKDQISGEVGWQQKSYPVDSGIHILKWRYVKDGSGQSGDDCGWVDFVQWTGPSPTQDPANWQEIAYKQDVTGRRVEKKVDGYSTRYVYDGPHVIAEYDGNNNLLRKYIYGPCTDEPVSMIEVADGNATYYYHFDALGSVVALSNASGDTVQTYEYSVYGEVAVEDANHTNPYMFAGVRYDIEIGLYYNRARYYNPYTGRFLQTDPIGYGDGMNLYTYCGNNSVVRTDPSGCIQLISPDSPWWWWPYTMDRGKPPYPGTWSAADFFRWYRYGNGQTVTLDNIGLLESFKEHVSPLLTIFQEGLIDEIKEYCQQLQELGITTGSYGVRGTLGYDLAPGGKAGIFLRLLARDPLVVMGNGTIEAEAYVWVERIWEDGVGWTDSWKWTVQIVYSVTDWFKDPGHLVDKPGQIEQEWAGCTPYMIVGTWHWEDSGVIDVIPDH
jgi:RHS repeat-associated protein